MSQRVLILGGRGRIGRQVTADLIAHTQAEIMMTGRNSRTGQVPELESQMQDTRLQFQPVELDNADSLKAAIHALHPDNPSSKNVVVHCAGPFHYRDASVLKTCIEAGVHYVDVSDHPSFTPKVMAYKAAAAAAGITAIAHTGIFPGISNSMVRQGVEQLDTADRIHLSYVVGGSGGAGITVMRTTFLGLQHPFQAWIGGQWQPIQPYSDRETIEFPPPYGRTGVYWFDVPETVTLPATFPVKTVITKFGTVPDFYNYLTWSVAHGWHPALLQQPWVIEFLSRVSYWMTTVTDRFSGIGVAIRAEVTGCKNSQPARCISTLVHKNTAVAAGAGAGSVAQLLLSGQLNKPGVWTVEEALPTDLFEQMMQHRGIHIQHQVIES